MLAPAATAAVRTARPADQLAGSVGVNVHLHFSGSVYDRGYAAIVKPKLLAAGIRHVRDGAYIYGGAASSSYYNRCRDLAAAGIRFNLLTSFKTRWSEPTDPSKLDDIYRWCNGGVESFEGVNEPDLQPIPPGYPDWKAQTVQAQKALFKAVNDNAAIRHVSVLGPTIVWAPTAVGDLSAHVDYGNWHPYPGGQCPTCGDVYGQNIDTFMPKYRTPSGAKPMIATETGYHNAINQGAGGHRPASELAAGKYTPRLALEYFNRGFVRTYFYELIDAKPEPAKTDRDAHFGLLRHDGSEKPAYRALKSLLTLTRDPGPSFTPGSLDYTISGDTSRVHQTLLQKRNGTFLLALWVERSSYHTGASPNAPDQVSARRDLTVPEQGVKLTFATPTTPATIHRFQNDGSTTRTTVTPTAGTLALNVSDRLTVVQFSRPKAATALGNEPPRLGRVRFSRKVLVMRARGRAAGRRARRVPKLSLRYSISEAATLAIAIKRVRPGRRHARSQRGVRRMTVRAERGRHSTRLRSRLVRRLRPGRYRARVTAIDGLGARSRTRTAVLRVRHP
jgi:hypothetical protein